MALLAEKIPAATAFEWGMISHVVDDEDYDTELETVVQALASGPTMSYQWGQAGVRRGNPFGASGVGAIEVEGQTALTRTVDFREGVTAFGTARSPKFQGN